MKAFISTRDLSNLVIENFPANDRKIREWCEAGTIPGTIAKRDETKQRAQWQIKVSGIPWILENVVKLSREEIAEVEARIIQAQ